QLCRLPSSAPPHHPPSFPTRRSSDLSKKPSTGTMQRRLRYASRNVGRFGTVSYFALIGLRPPVGSLHQYGIRPQRSGSSETSPVDRKSTRLNSSHVSISYAVFCLKKK